MKNERNGKRSKYTVFTGSYQAFVGTAISPNDPEFKRAERRGPNSPQALAKKRGKKKK
jgi:hypothetical protein